MIPTESLFEDLRAIYAEAAKGHEDIYQKLIMNGNKLELSLLGSDLRPGEGERFRIYDINRSFKGIYSYEAEEDRLVPYKMFF